MCKSFEADKLINIIHPSRIFFICDGRNDFCLARHLNYNDILFVRKNFKLYHKLFDNKDDCYNLKCKIVPWDSADEIIHYID